MKKDLKAAIILGSMIFAVFCVCGEVETGCFDWFGLICLIYSIWVLAANLLPSKRRKKRSRSRASQPATK